MSESSVNSGPLNQGIPPADKDTPPAEGTNHPADKTLLLFATGRLDASAAAPLEQHVLDCPSCAQRIADLDESNDSFVANFRVAHQPEDATAGLSLAAAALRPAEGPPPGSRLGEYVVKKSLGQGGMGVVYEAQHATMRRRVALKVLSPQLNADEAYVERFQREARAAGGLHHTNIVPVFDVGADQGFHYFSMQLIDGQSLDTVLDELRRLHRTAEEAVPSTVSSNVNIARGLYSGGVSGDEEADSQSTPANQNATGHLADSSAARGDYYRRIARLGRQIAEALDYAHRHGILHRDIKPANILLDDSGTAWVTDFGLAKSEDDNLTRTGDIVGTLRYMAPERFQGEADARSDVYGLGLTLYELCTFRNTFENTDRAGLIHDVLHEQPPPPRRVNPHVPRDLETIVLKAIDKQPRHRYQTARELAVDLRLFVEDRPIRARRTPAWERIWRWCRRNPQQALLAGCVAVLLAMLLAGSLYYSYRSGKDAELLAAENRRANTQLYRELRTRVALAPSTRRVGQRFESIEAVRQAVALLPKLGLNDREMEEHRLGLRNDAIAAFSLFDVEEVARRKIEAPWTVSVVFNSTHDTYAHSDSKGNIEIRRFEDNRRLARLPGPGRGAWRMGFSPDDRFLAATYYDSSPAITILWKIATQKKILELNKNLMKSKEYPMKGRIVFSGDGRRMAVGFAGGRMRLYGLPEGRVKREFQMKTGPTAYCFSPSGEQLAVTAYKSPRLTIWHLATGVSRHFEARHTLTEVAWSASGLLAAGCSNGHICLWRADGEGGEFDILQGHRFRIMHLHFSDDGRALASDSTDGTVRFWNTALETEALRADGATLIDSGFGRDGQRIGYWTEDRQFGLWRLPKAGPWRVGENSRRAAARWDLQFSPEGRLFAASTESGVEIWDAEAARLVKFLPIGDTKTAAFSPDGASLITSGEEGLRRWPIHRSPRAGRRMTIGPPVVLVEGPTRRAELDSTGSHVALVRGYQAALVELSDPKRQIPIAEHESLFQATLSPNAKWLVTTTWQGQGIRVWAVDGGQLIRDLDPQARNAAVAFSPDGRLLAASGGAEIRLWEVPSWRLRKRIQKNPRDPWAFPLKFSPDGRLLAAPFSQHSIQLIDVAAGKTLAVLGTSQPGSVNHDCCFSPDSRVLAYSAADEVHLWDLHRLRARLADLELDWEWPRHPVKAVTEDPEPLLVEVLLDEAAAKE